MKTLPDPIPTFSGKENLDRPVDADINVTPAGPNWKIALMQDGEPVSSLTLIDYDQQIGDSLIRMGGIAGVGTPPQHRNKGYARCLLDNSLRWMRQNGFAVSMLFGIQRIYPKFGFAEAFPGIRFRLSLPVAERIGASSGRWEKFQPDHLKAFLRLYHRNNAGRTGPTLRHSHSWRAFLHGSDWGIVAACEVLIGKRGTLDGYLVYDDLPDAARITEVGYRSTKVLPSVMKRCAEVAWDRRQNQIDFQLPEDHPLMAFCQPHGLQKEVVWRLDGGAMVRMIHLRRALESISETLTQRVSGTGRLALHTNLDSVSIEWSRRKVRIGEVRSGDMSVRMPQWALAQLIYGYASATSLSDAGTLRGSKDAISKLNQLFPVHPHYYHPIDAF